MPRILAVLRYLNARKFAIFATVGSVSIAFCTIWMVLTIFHYFLLIESEAAFPEFNYALWHHRIADSPVTVGLAIYILCLYLLRKILALAYCAFTNIADLWEEPTYDGRKAKPVGDGADAGANNQGEAQTYFG